MADPHITIKIDGKDNASDELKQVNRAMGDMDKQSQSLSMTMVGISSAIGIAKEAYAVLNQVVTETINKTVDYAEEVDKLARITGNSAEETSKLIQVADDVEISYETLTRAMQGAVRKGVDPSIESVAKLSDQYKALAPGLDRTKFLMDNFGRSGSDMARIMERGGDAILEMSAAVDASLIMTQDAIDAAQEYELAMDNLGDAVDGVKYQIGNALIPTLTDLINATVDVNGYIIEGTDNYDSYKAAMKLAGVDANTLTEAQYNQVKASQEQAAELDKLGGEFDEATEGANAFAEAEAAITQQMSELKLFMSGPLKSENERYQQDVENLTERGGELQAKIAELEGMQWRTPAQEEQITGLYGDLEQVNQKIVESGEKHDEATKRILLNIAEQRFAVDGLSQAEADVLAEMANDWGLVDDATFKAYEIMGRYNTAINNGTLSADDLRDAINGIPNEKVITINTVMGSQWSQFGRMSLGHAAGGDVFAGQSYIVGEQGAERFVPDTNGRIVPNKDIGGGNVYITYAPGISMGDQQEFASRMQPLIIQAVRDAKQRGGYPA